MRLILSLLVAAANLASARPRYGGTLVIETRAAVTALTSPPEILWLETLVAESGPFRVAEFTPSRRLLVIANDGHAAGRPFLDQIEVRLNRSLRDQLTSFETGQADVIELPLTEIRRQQQRNRPIWTSSALDLIALSFARSHTTTQSETLRRAIALSIDRQPILNVLLQKHGEASASLLPHWLTGYGFLFPAQRDLARARTLLSPKPAPLTLSFDPNDLLLRPIADRIALNTRDADIFLRVSTAADADINLIRITGAPGEPGAALNYFCNALSLFAGPRKESFESLHSAERKALEGAWVIPLFHIPAVYGLSNRVRGWAPSNTHAWQLADVWLESAQ